MQYRRSSVLLVMAIMTLLAVPSSLFATIYVKWDAPGPTFDGKSWATAYKTIQTAANRAVTNEEIWVARGIYSEHISASVICRLYGGFEGTETSLSQRNWRQNVSTIIGSSGQVTVAFNNGGTIDGFTVIGGYGIQVAAGSATVSNNRITKCNWGVDIDYKCSLSTVSNNQIFDNGTGIITTAPVKIVNNTIVANGEGLWNGNHIYLTGTLVANNIVAFNSYGIDYEVYTGIYNNCVYGNQENYSNLPPGSDDISVDPLFVSLEQGDLHIQPASLCRNAGDNSIVIDSVDIDGQPRIADARVDIGADESDGTSPIVTPRVVYVNNSAAGGDGNSWATAYKKIQDAADDVTTNGPAQIWVAKGTYNENITLGAFTHLYGGFSGTESNLSQRNTQTNLTTIKGMGSSSGTWAVTMKQVSTIDGFTITDGEIGVCGTGAHQVISNNVFSGNRGALNVEDAIITCNTISGNYNAVFCDSGEIKNNKITNNQTGVDIHEGIVANNVVAGNAEYAVQCSKDIVVSGNIIAGSHKGIKTDGYYGGSVITNNTVVGNDYGVWSDGDSSDQLANNIIAFNNVGLINKASVAPTLSNNDVYGNTTDYSGLIAGPADISVDPLFAKSYELGDYHIQPASLCRNAGTNSAPGLTATDLDGQIRIQGDTVDIGADESDGTTWSSTPRVVYVKATAAAGGNGTTWTKAYQTIQAALDDVAAKGGAEIWVARGTYTGPFKLVCSAQLYGGFVGSESSKNSRNVKNYKCVLYADNMPYYADVVVVAAGLSRIDGFTITGGNMGISCDYASPVIVNNTLIGTGQCGIYYSTANPTVASNVIVGSDVGIYCFDGSPSITNNTVVNCGNGVFAISFDTRVTSPKLVNNLLAYNAKGIVSDGTLSTPILSHNNVFGSITNYVGVTAGEGDISQDPLLANINAANFHILPTSPCKDAGLNITLGALTRDIDSQARVQNGTIDIGADESDGTVPSATLRVLYVNRSAASGGSGLNWIHPYNSITAAMNNIKANGPAEVWVTKGTYNERLQLAPFTQLYGGFAGNETSRNSRNWLTNVTKICGGIDGYSSIDGYGACVSRVDGFSVGSRAGAGIYLISSPAVITNNIFDCGNYGLYIGGGTSVISGNVIVNAALQGVNLIGGEFGREESSSIITNNTIVGNGQIGIRSYGTSPIITNNIIARNGTGILHSKASNGHPANPVLSHNDVFGNTTNYSGLSAGATDISLDPKLKDSLADFHLTENSPCIDVGISSAPGLEALDIDGEGRIYRLSVDIGADEYWTAPLDISQAKKSADGTFVTGSRSVVTAVTFDYFYIEAADRSSAIRVCRPGHTMTVGKTASVTGTMRTTEDGERYVDNPTVFVDGTGTVLPMIITNKDLGGADWNYNPSTGSGQRGVEDGVGLNNIGLLVKTTGLVTVVGDDFFYIDDGTHAHDRSIFNGIRVPCGSMAKPVKGQQVSVTGISSIMNIGGRFFRSIRPRTVEDILPL